MQVWQLLASDLPTVIHFDRREDGTAQPLPEPRHCPCNVILRGKQTGSSMVLGRELLQKAVVNGHINPENMDSQVCMTGELLKNFGLISNFSVGNQEQGG